MQIHVYGDTAVVLMLYTQKATVRGQDRSGQLVITDIWVNGSKGWRIVERHSSRPEVPALTRP
jgi:ketosteroid isomerase-like protein